MAIQSGNSVDVLITSSDTTIINPTNGRILITSATIHEQTSAAETLELFVSTDATSAAGERIETITFSANEIKTPTSLIRGIPVSNYLIGNATNGSRVMVSITYTTYTGDS